MFCPNCGKQIKESDNFCRFCGTYLKDEQNCEQVLQYFEKTDNTVEDANLDIREEFVLYEVKKHFISLFWTIFLTPLFIFYFWNVFLNTHSFFSWIVVFALLALIFYPIMRYKSDSLVITNKFAHIKVGVLNPSHKDIPINDLACINVSQSSMGRMLDYGHVTFSFIDNSIDFGDVENPEDLQYIIDNPKEFIQESLKEDEMAV